MDQEIIYLVHFFFGNAVRRHYIHRIAQWAQINTVGQRLLCNGRADSIDVPIMAGVELKGQDRSDSAGIFDDRVEGKDFQKSFVPVSYMPDRPQVILFQQQVEAGQRGSTGDRIGGKGVSVEQGTPSSRLSAPCSDK